MNRPSIVYEVKMFLARHRMPIRRLAHEAGLLPGSLGRVLKGTRKDMSSGDADRLRSAMFRLAQGIPVTTTPTTSPGAESGEKEADDV